MTPANGAIAAAIEAGDFLRRSASAFSAGRGHKEWMHFTVHAPGLDVLVNFSITEPWPAAPGRRMHRVACLVRGADWDGDMDAYEAPDCAARFGAIDLRFGECTVVYRDGAFEIRAALRKRPIAVELRLVPQVLPSESHNVAFDDSPPLSWCVVPRLSATGVVRAFDRCYAVVDAPAYHDHNWGYFRWGKSFVWEWGYGIPAHPGNPWTAVFARFKRHGNGADLMRGVLLWNGVRPARIFRGEEVEVRHEGFLSPSRVFKVPRPMALVAPGLSTDVPARFVATAAGRGDRVELEFLPESVAQILTPNDDDLGTTVINEVAGRLSVAGRVRGEPLCFSGPSTFEFMSD